MHLTGIFSQLHERVSRGLPRPVDPELLLSYLYLSYSQSRTSAWGALLTYLDDAMYPGTGPALGCWSLCTRVSGHAMAYSPLCTRVRSRSGLLDVTYPGVRPRSGLLDVVQPGDRTRTRRGLFQVDRGVPGPVHSWAINDVVKLTNFSLMTT